MVIHNLVQPIIVAKTGSHEETIYCSALASLEAYENAKKENVFLDSYDLWLSGSFTKSVRRASMKDILTLALWCANENIPYAVHAIGDSAALALPPMSYDAYPKIAKRAQVSGTDFPKKNIFPYYDSDTKVNISFLASLTTGKASAQTAHALWAAYLREPEKINSETYIQFSTASAHELKAKLAEGQCYAIFDKGLTEIEPNTLTAISFFD